jgi:hypothetical protein
MNMLGLKVNPESASNALEEASSIS